MKSLSGTLGLVMLFASLSFGASGGMISGTVKGPDGSRFKGAYVRAQNEKNQITVVVLSNRQGEYTIQNLKPGEYQVRATAIGYKSEPRGAVKVNAAQPVSLDFALQKGMVRWSDLSIHQGRVLLPDAPGKTEYFTSCFNCHGFQSRLVTRPRDENGWRNAVNNMMDPVVGMGHLYYGEPTDQEKAKIASYLNTVFGLDSELPQSPAQLPEYEKVKHAEFSDEAMKIVYVEYDVPGPNRFPWNANPDGKGTIWVPYYGRGNRIAKLNPETGEVQEFPVPYTGTAGIHGAEAAPDGTVWFSEQGPCKVGKFDPKTEKFTEYQCPPNPEGKTKREQQGNTNEARIDRLGYIWTSGRPLRRFDPKTEKFMQFPEIRTPYDIEFDKQGNLWFSEMPEEGKIGKVDIRTLKITTWAPPTPKYSVKRIAFDSHGILWFNEYRAGQIGRFDPKTETFKEFPLPDPDPTPYGLGIDRHDFVWYNSDHDDIIGRLDPNTGEVVEFPFPYQENGIREIRPDSEGRMWFTTPPNNKVGYFIPPEVPETVSEGRVPR